MTTYIFILLGIIIVLLVAVLMRKPTVDISALREDNIRHRRTNSAQNNITTKFHLQHIKNLFIIVMIAKD